MDKDGMKEIRFKIHGKKHRGLEKEAEDLDISLVALVKIKLFKKEEEKK